MSVPVVIGNDWIIPTPAAIVGPKDQFRGMDATVDDFWQFALSDLRMNNARGYLAEFIVARSLGLVHARRIEWAEYDVEFEGISIEVKSSAYLQSWEQPRLSAISFTGLKGTQYSPRAGYSSAGKQFNAMVYVFCVQAAREHEQYDVLDIGQWEFYVLPRSALVARGFASISRSALATLTNAVLFAEIADAVRAAGARQ